MATTSSGFTPLCGSLPKNFLTASCTIGMRVEPPTSTTSWMSAGVLFASASAFLQGSSVRCDQVVDHLLELGARERRFMCLGPDASAVRNGRLIVVSSFELKLDLGLLRGVLEALQDHLVLARRRCPGRFLNSATR